MAGVIGKSMLCYDVWGDTVNTASRMYSTCITGHVQCTKETKDLLHPTHHLTKRGQVQVKGKGLMTTYFVNRRRITVNKSLGASPRPGGIATETHRGTTMCEDDENWVVGVTGRDKNQAESDSEMKNEVKGGKRDSPNSTHSRDSDRTESNASDLTEDDPNYQSTPGHTPPGHSRRGSSFTSGTEMGGVASAGRGGLSGTKGRNLGHSSSALAADQPHNNSGHTRRQSKSDRDLRKQIVRRASQSRSLRNQHSSSAGSLSKHSWSGRKKDAFTNPSGSSGSSSVVEAEDALDFTEGRLRGSQSSEAGSSSMLSTRSRHDSIEYGLPMSKPKLRSSDSSESGLFSVNLVKKTLDRKLSKGQLLQDDDMGDVDRMANVANKREARRRSLVGGDALGLGSDSALKAAIAVANAMYNDAGGELGRSVSSVSTSVDEDSSQSSERPVTWGSHKKSLSAGSDTLQRAGSSGLGRGSLLNPNSSVGPIEAIGEDENMSGSEESQTPSMVRYPGSPQFQTSTPKGLTNPVNFSLSPPEAEDDNNDNNDDNDVGSGDILVDILDDSPRGGQFPGEGEFEAKQVSVELRVLTPSKSFRERGKRGGSLRRREDEDLQVDFDPDLALPAQVTELALSTKSLSPEGARAEETLAAARNALWSGPNNRLRRKSKTDDGGDSFHRRGLSAPITPVNRVTRGKSTGSPRHRGSPPITVVKTYDEAEYVRLSLGGTPRGASRKGGKGPVTGADKRKFFLETNPDVFSSSDYSQPSPTDLRSRTHPPRQSSSSGRQDYSSSGQQGHGTMDREQAQSSSYRHHSSTLESQMDDEELLSTQFESEGLIHAMRMTRGDTMEYVEMDGWMMCVCVCVCVCV